MARTDRFMIAPISSGLQNDLKPWMIPDDAFQELNNAYVFRGRLKKRFGTRFMRGSVQPVQGVEQLQSRLRINVGTTNGSGNISASVSGLIFDIGQMFSVGSQVFTVYQNGTMFNGSIVGVTDNSGNATGNANGSVWAIGQSFMIGSQVFTVTLANGALTTTGSGSGTFNTATGAYTFTGCSPDTLIQYSNVQGSGTYNTANGAFSISSADPSENVYFYPSDPVMGIASYEQDNTDASLTFAWDTQFSYVFGASGWSRLGTAVWKGSNKDYFWWYNYRGITSNQTFLFVSNYYFKSTIATSDPMYYWDSSNWNAFSPIVSNTNQLITGKIIVPFKDRLVVLNTVEAVDGAQFSAPNLTDPVTGNFSQTVAGSYSIGQRFVVGSTIYTIASVAAGAQAMTVAAYPGTATPPTATFDASTGALVITGNGNNRNLPVYFFNGTLGTPTVFANRCRYSLNGNPVLTNGWLEQGGLGGFIDAPTKESIVTAQFLKDRLIVFFEASTWELVYTGNQILPFVWQQINTELGAVSTFSEIPFDKIVLGVGNTGIHACNGSNVDRIDEKIPDTVWFVNLTTEVVDRVYGIRDYFSEMVYWSFPDPYASDSSGFNKKILTYNYKTGSWAFNDDSATAFGYYYPASAEGNTWLSDPDTWESSEYTWATSTSPLVTKSQTIIMGNQEGYVLQINNDTARNAPGLQITNMTKVNDYVQITCVNHNLQPGFPVLVPGEDNEDRSNAQGDFILIEGALGVTGFSDSGIYPVAFVIDANTIQIKEPNFVGTYRGNGTLARVSNVQITTKQYNFYVQDGRNALINKVDFLVDKTDNGEITVDYSVSSSSQSQLVKGQRNGSVLGTGTLDTKPYDLVPLEQVQDRLWHPVYPMAEGECIQLNIYFTFNQITNSLISLSDFEMHAMTFYVQPTSSRLQ